jgi:SpoVK/Ycf46/Vps4 family AAA+-type ATPase
MHAVALRALQSAQRPVARSACRLIGGVRHPLSQRSFHSSAISYRLPQQPPPTEGDKENNNNEESQPEQDEDLAEDPAPERVVTEPDLLALSSRLRNGKTQGSGRRGGSRPRVPEGLPPVVLPDWFWSKNVKCVGDPDLSGSLAVYGENGLSSVTDGENTSLDEEVAQQALDVSNCELSPTETAKYSMHVHVYKEILSTLRAGLTLNPPRNTGTKTLVRPITVLQCPKDGGSYYLDSVVETIAGKLNADLVRLDAQDIAHIVGSYADDNLAWTTTTTALLAYDAHKYAGRVEVYEKESMEENEEEENEEQEGVVLPNLAKLFGRVKNSNFSKRTPNPFANFDVTMLKLKKDDSDSPQFAQFSTQTAGQAADLWNDLKTTTVLDTLVGSADAKRGRSKLAATTTPIECKDITVENPLSEPRDVIIQIRDYNEIMKTAEGARILWRLRNSIDKKWQEKRNIICVGTTSIEAEVVFAKADIQELQSDIIECEKRTIFVPPDRREQQDVAFEMDEKARIRRINVRHVEDMIMKLADGSQHLTGLVDIEKDVDSAVIFSAGLEDSVWSYARVHRVATTILGLEKKEGILDGAVFGEALKLLAASDEAKFSWGATELKQEDDEAEAIRYSGIDAEKRKAKDKLRDLKKRCNQFEKKLLSGVVFPSDLHTTFADIRAPKETIEALQTLTSLSLLRPEAFSYGVLATDKIPGLLLYGPPGTGKTLLAKAVAKESGATVLEITAADLNDMFVGQGEKNVRAVFTLAKKLSPCVVFLDEADAIFSARSHHNRNAHREMINQFLREWDGMTTDLSAFIMLATNRPFDLDEAVLRRLPRRLLVDLPTEKDREAILNIHLKDETLGPSVSLTKLAHDTPFYSGSDLKNVSVAAALACVREENAAASAHNGEEPYVYPERRTLTSSHFEKALEEISASISEDMSTLTAIRKFDEKYGDRKGRKKRGPGLGFGGARTEEKDSEAAMVRKLET